MNLDLMEFILDNLPNKKKGGAHVKNLDKYADVGTHWRALYVKYIEIIYFDSFGVEHIPKEIKIFIGNKNIQTNIFRIKAYDLVVCAYFCIGFIDFMLNPYTLCCLSIPSESIRKPVFSFQGLQISNTGL